MLQIALLLLACGLSRYMWSINTSVALVVLTLTVLGLVFYVGVVIAGTSSYECPFQTPASTSLRALRNHRTAQKLLARLSLAAYRSLQALQDILIPQNSLANPSIPRIPSFVSTTMRLALERLVSVYRRVSDAVRNPPSLYISSSGIVLGARSMCWKVGHLSIILLLHVDRILVNAKQRLYQWIRRHKRVLLPIFNGANHQPHTRQRGGLLVSPANLENLRKQNADNARCVCWILWNITDPEAIDAALRLACTVRWFEGDVDTDPPYDIILSSFQDCLDPDNVLYPGMRDRAFISGKALVQIHVCAALRSDRFRYPIPEFPWGCSPRGVLHFIGQVNLSAGKDISESPANMLWMSALLVAVARLSPNPDGYPQGGIAPVFHGRLGTSRTMDGNILLAWYLILGGHVEEETFWADDKSCVFFTS